MSQAELGHFENMGKLKDVYWISSPLGYEKRIEVSEEWKSRKYAPAALGKLVDPHKEFKWFQKIKHWTLEIDGKCYELWATGHKNIVQSKFSTDLCEPKSKDAQEWHDFRKKHGIEPIRRKVGQTRLSHDKIEKKGEACCCIYGDSILTVHNTVQEIWKEFNHGTQCFMPSR